MGLSTMRTKKKETATMARESGKTDQAPYPHTPFNRFFGPSNPGAVVTYRLEKAEEKGTQGIQARKDRILSYLRNNHFRHTTFAYTYEDAIRAAGLDITPNGQIDWIAHRGYQTDKEPKVGGSVRIQIHSEGAGSFRRLQEILEITGLVEKTDKASG